MARSSSHKIETDSRIIFENTIHHYKNEELNIQRGNLLFRKMDERDYGIDGQIEIFENGETTGKIAYIQLKGTLSKIEKLKKSEHVSCKGVSKSNLGYCRQHNIPVILVYISIETEEFYFIDLQTVYKDAIEKIGDNESCSVRIPVENNPKNLDKMVRIINNYYDNDSIKYEERKDSIIEDDNNDDYFVGDKYIVNPLQMPTDGEHKIVNEAGKVLAIGYFENKILKIGTEYNWLIKVTKGKLIFKPNRPEDPYDSTDDFEYEKYEQYDREDFLPLSLSLPYIENSDLNVFYVVDMEVDGDLEQMFNIRTLKEFLKENNPKLLKQIEK